MQIFDFGSACRDVVSKIREREACLATLRTQNSYDGESIFCYFSFFFKEKNESRGECEEHIRRWRTRTKLNYSPISSQITWACHYCRIIRRRFARLSKRPSLFTASCNAWGWGPFQGEWEKRKAVRIYCSSELLVLRWCIFVSARVLGSAYTSTTPKSK